MATSLVAVIPVLAAWELRVRGTVRSPVLGILVAVALSLVLAALAEAWWMRRRAPEDLVFSELLIWGWLRRWRFERLLANADEVMAQLAATHPGDAMRRQARLLRQLARALEAQDAYLEGHSRRVARHAAMIARRMGLSREEVMKVRAAAAIHDVGKLNVPLEVLDKPGPLTEAEFALIKRHPADGEAIVAGLRDDDLSTIVRHHHERFDGYGYPDNLSGEEIPLGARIVAVADTFDAITSARAYRPAAPHRRALEILRESSGSQLDPNAVHAFLSHYAGRGPIALWCALWSGLPRLIPGSSRSTLASSASGGKIVAMAMASAAIGVGGLTSTGTPGSRAGAFSTSSLQASVVSLPSSPGDGTAVATAAERPSVAGAAAGGGARAGGRRAAHAARARDVAATPSGSGSAGGARRVGSGGRTSRRSVGSNGGSRRSGSGGSGGHGGAGGPSNTSTGGWTIPAGSLGTGSQPAANSGTGTVAPAGGSSSGPATSSAPAPSNGSTTTGTSSSGSTVSSGSTGSGTSTTGTGGSPGGGGGGGSSGGSDGSGDGSDGENSGGPGDSEGDGHGHSHQNQGASHGRGPDGSGPPGQTGQNPGHGGGPPPGLAKS